MLSDPRSSRPLRAAGYVRVSRSDQRADLQAHEVTELIERRGWKLTELFADHGVSGARDRRPALDRLLAAARRREFDVLVVWRSDRLFRSLRHMVLTLADLTALGVGFASVREPFDSSTPSGALMLGLISAFSEFERNVLIERTKAGLDAARRRGARIGRPRAVFDIDEARARVEAGETIAAVARDLGVGASTVRRALRGAVCADQAA